MTKQRFITHTGGGILKQGQRTAFWEEVQKERKWMQVHRCSIKDKSSWCRIWERHPPSMGYERECLMYLVVLVGLSPVSTLLKMTDTVKQWYSEVVSTKSKYQQRSQFVFFCLHIRDSFFVSSCCDILLKNWALILPAMFVFWYPWSTLPWRNLCFQRETKRWAYLVIPTREMKGEDYLQLSPFSGTSHRWLDESVNDQRIC